MVVEEEKDEVRKNEQWTVVTGKKNKVGKGQTGMTKELDITI